MELNEYKQRIEQNDQENNVMKNRIQKLLNENSSLSG